MYILDVVYLYIVCLKVVSLGTVFLDIAHLDISVQVCEHVSYGTRKLTQQLRHEIAEA